MFRSTKEQDNDQIDSGLGDSFGSFADQNVEPTRNELEPISIDESKLKESPTEEEKQNIIQILRQAFTPDEDNDTYLHIFIARGIVEKTLQLIKICPQKELLNIQNNLGQTALHVATFVNFYQIVEELIHNGADLEYVDKDGRNIFHLCAQRGHIETFNSIINAACQTNQMDKVKNLIDDRDYNGLSPFYLAVSNKREDICKRLVDLKADVNLSDARNGNSPLHEAVVHPDCDHSFVEFLIKNCCLNVNHQNYAGITPLHCAAGKGDTTLFSRLLINGAEAEITDISGNTPIVYGNPEIRILAK